ncbi:MAG: transposase [Planctomycetia bacterium]|nr:transposase [Planctomycetia bacterium]
MVFGELFERFLEAAPACVMHRALMENIFAPEKLDAVFHGAAEIQYERELLFSTVVELTSQVVCRLSQSTRMAYLAQRERIAVSLQAIYDKLSHIELGTSQALVRYTGQQASELIDRCKGLRAPLLKGYRMRILDGNHLGKTNRRLKVLRNTAAGALPGQSLVLLDPQRMVIDEVVLCEDGHAQERSVLGQVVPLLERRDLLIADRNFCTLPFLFGMLDRRACFIVREHRRMPWKSLGKARYVGLCETGRVYEEPIELRDPQIGRTTQVRRITIRLNSPTRDDDQEIHLHTNLPAKVSSIKVAGLYHKRWTLEQAFNELTTHLRCELNTLGYPKAALFAFCVAVCSYNALAALKGALRGVRGDEAMEKEVSNFYLTSEIQSVYGGMMVALPPIKWRQFQSLNPAQLAGQLLRWTRAIDWHRYRKYPRGPEKPKRKLPNAQSQHVATSQLLEKQRLRKKRKQTAPGPGP